MCSRLAIALLLIAVLPAGASAQGFRLPKVDLSGVDPTNPNSRVRKETRNFDSGRLDAMSRSPRAGRDYTKIYLKNETDETISVIIHVIPFEVRDGNATYIESPIQGPWVTKGWYKLEPGERAYVVNTNNTRVYTYAKTNNGKEWSGSHRINTGTRSEPRYYQFTQKFVGIDVPEEWTFSFSPRE